MVGHSHRPRHNERARLCRRNSLSRIGRGRSVPRCHGLLGRGINACIDNPNGSASLKAADCWTGANYASGLTWARGVIGGTQTSRTVQAYAFGNLKARAEADEVAYMAYVQGYQSSGLASCAQADDDADGAYETNTSPGCNNTNFIYVTAIIDP